MLVVSLETRCCFLKKLSDCTSVDWWQKIWRKQFFDKMSEQHISFNFLKSRVSDLAAIYQKHFVIINVVLFPEITHVFLYTRKIFIKKMMLKTPKTLRKCYENLQPQMPELQFLKRWFFLELFKSYKIEEILAFLLNSFLAPLLKNDVYCVHVLFC